MRILCVIDSLGPGGAQRQLVGLAVGFKDKGHSVFFMTYHESSFFKPLLDKAGISITCIKASNYLSRVLIMRKFIRTNKFDVVISFLETPTFICELAALPTRTWVQIAGERNANPRITKSPKLILFRWFHFFADYIVANSSVNLNMVRSVNRFLPKESCKVIYNIIDFGRWKPAPNYKRGIKDKIKIIVAASHCYRKNLNGLIDALSLLTFSELTKIKIEWYGDPIYPPYLDNSLPEALSKIKQYQLEDIISLHKATHDITTIVQMADVVGLFSLHEGLPNTVCEGMACGKPVICSAISDLPLLLSHDPGLLFDPTKPESIKVAIEYLISLNREQLKSIGLKNYFVARENFDYESIVNKYLQLFVK